MTLPSVLVVIEQSARSRYFEAAIPLLSAAGCRTMLATIRRPGPIHEVVREHSFATSMHCNSAAGYVRAAGRLARLANRERVDVIHAHEPIPAAIASLAKPLIGRALV